MESNSNLQQSGPITTVDSSKDERLKVDVGRKKILKSILKKYGKNKKRNN
jgi:hypothetical protein